MDLQELQRMMDTVQIGGIFLENTAFSYLEAFSENVLYYVLIGLHQQTTKYMESPKNGTLSMVT